jgi:glycosylphosphatidylinositol transamidase (GPIT) subunit GPI8
MDKTKNFNESFEDLTHDCLVNKIRFIAIDCRLNSLKKECSLPNTLSIDLTS